MNAFEHIKREIQHWTSIYLFQLILLDFEKHSYGR